MGRFPATMIILLAIATVACFIALSGHELQATEENTVSESAQASRSHYSVSDAEAQVRAAKIAEEHAVASVDAAVRRSHTRAAKKKAVAKKKAKAAKKLKKVLKKKMKKAVAKASKESKRKKKKMAQMKKRMKKMAALLKKRMGHHHHKKKKKA